MFCWTGILWWFLLAISGGAFLYLCGRVSAKGIGEGRASVILLAGILVALICVCSPFWYEFPATGYSVPVTFAGAGTNDFRIIRHPWGLITLDWNKIVANMPLEGTRYRSEDYDQLVSLSDGANRRFSFSVGAQFKDPKKFYRLFGRRDEIDKPEQIAREILRSKLGPFLRAVGQGLTKFDDPSNLAQRTLFNSLARVYFTSYLQEEGFDFAEATFRLDEATSKGGGF